VDLLRWVYKKLLQPESLIEISDTYILFLTKLQKTQTLSSGFILIENDIIDLTNYCYFMDLS